MAVRQLRAAYVSVRKVHRRNHTTRLPERRQTDALADWEACLFEPRNADLQRRCRNNELYAKADRSAWRCEFKLISVEVVVVVQHLSAPSDESPTIPRRKGPFGEPNVSQVVRVVCGTTSARAVRPPHDRRQRVETGCVQSPVPVRCCVDETPPLRVLTVFDMLERVVAMDPHRHNG